MLLLQRIPVSRLCSCLFNVTRSFSHLLNVQKTPLLTARRPPPLLLSPPSSAGMKWVATPKKRCKDCYFEVQDEITYVFCPTHPRHKQGSKIPKLKYSWIMTHATNGSKTRNRHSGRREMWTQHAFRLDF